MRFVLISVLVFHAYLQVVAVAISVKDLGHKYHLDNTAVYAYSRFATINAHMMTKVPEPFIGPCYDLYIKVHFVMTK